MGYLEIVKYQITVEPSQNHKYYHLPLLKNRLIWLRNIVR